MAQHKADSHTIGRMGLGVPRDLESFTSSNWLLGFWLAMQSEEGHAQKTYSRKVRGEQRAPSAGTRLGESMSHGC